MTVDERELCWAEFDLATKERHHAFRQPVLLSIDSDGFPSGRVLTLRQAIPGRSILRFHIDRRSPKFAQWAANSAAGGVFYDGPRKWQVRVKGRVTLHFDNDYARACWDACHPMSKRTYLTTFPPGEPIAWDSPSPFPPGLEKRRPTPTESEAGYANFAVMLLEVLELDSLHLAGEGHQRFQIINGVHKVRRVAP